MQKPGTGFLPHGDDPQRPVPIAHPFTAGQHLAHLPAPAETQRLADAREPWNHNDTHRPDSERSMNERTVSRAYGADDPGLPSPPVVTDVRHTLRERSRNAFADAEPRLEPTVPVAVRRWKLWLLTVCGIYPTIVLLGLVTNPVLEDLYLPVRLAVLVPAAAAAMVWQINPRLQRYFGAWLTR
ncbi:hypothetical protein OG983_05960 [Streptomyces jietaisiensis]|uniref:hypothetical protein n=2 Tax=Streptomyces griseoaurantiacus TaxID=68213 RepID=UPI002E2F6446|nr:hypothetical protein [Streptomyces jietaisiensis]